MVRELAEGREGPQTRLAAQEELDTLTQALDLLRRRHRTAVRHDQAEGELKQPRPRLWRVLQRLERRHTGGLPAEDPGIGAATGPDGQFVRAVRVQDDDNPTMRREG